MSGGYRGPSPHLAELNRARKGKTYEEIFGKEEAERRKGIPVGMTGKTHPEERKARMSASRKRWIRENPEKFSKGIQRSMLSQATNRPTGPEKKMLVFLSENFPDQWIYVGDGSLMLGRFNPDFVNIEKMLLLELYGYSHIGEGARRDRRLTELSEWGFRTIEVWISEMRDVEVLKRKISEVQNGDSGMRREQL